MCNVLLNFVTRMESGLAPRRTENLPQALGPGPKTSSCNSLKSENPDVVFHGKKIKKNCKYCNIMERRHNKEDRTMYDLDIFVFAIFPQFRHLSTVHRQVDRQSP